MGRLNTKQMNLLVAFGIAVVAVAGYWQIQTHTFVNYDDNLYVTANAHVQAGLNWKNFLWAFTARDTGNWFPLTWLSHMTDCQLYGLNPSGHHLTNLGLHLANVVGLYFLLSWITGRLWPAAIVATLFGIHPLNVESVAWVAERKNLLCALFCILTALGYAWYAKRPGLKRYAIVIVTFLMAIMSKPTAVTLPFVLLLLDYWPLKRITFNDPGKTPSMEAAAGETLPAFGSTKLSRLLVEKIPLVLLSAADCLLTVLAQKQARNMPTTDQFAFAIRFQNAIVSYAEYLYKTVWPVDLAVFYPHPGSSLHKGKIILAALLLAGIAVGVIRLSRRSKYLAVGWLWYLGSLVPVIGLVQVGGQAMADRYAYLPLIGIFVLAVWGAEEIVERHKGMGRAAAMLWIGGAAALLIVTRIQLGYWKDSRTLFEHALMVTENNYVAYNNLGEVLVSEGKVQEAGPWFARALEIDSGVEAAHLNLGLVLVHDGRVDEGIAHFKEAAEIDPDSCDAYNRLGTAFLRKGDLDKAAEYLNKALNIDPSYGPAVADLGIVQSEQGRYDDAIASFERGLQFASSPEMAIQLRYWLANLYLQKGMQHEAADEYRQVLKLKPDLDAAAQALANLEGQRN